MIQEWGPAAQKYFVKKYDPATLEEKSSNDISKKYTTSERNKNQKLIDELYKDNNQPFVIFILELKFIDAFNYFNGENNVKKGIGSPNSNELKKIELKKHI